MKSFAPLIAATASVVNALAFPELSERHGPPSYPHPGPTGPRLELEAVHQPCCLWGQLLG